MATFRAGTIPSSTPNALLDLGQADRAAQGTRLNDLLLLDRAQAQQDRQTVQDLAPQIAAGDRGAITQAVLADPQRGLAALRGLAAADDGQRRQAEARRAVLGGVADSILQLPEEQRGPAYQVGVQALRGAGFDLAGVPDAYPGQAGLSVFRDMALSPGEANLVRRRYGAPADGPGAGPPAPGPTLAPDISGSRYASLVQAAADGHGVPRSLALAMVGAESGGAHIDPTTGRTLVSQAGAMGLTQLMPGTAAALGVDPHDPTQNALGGVGYLGQMLRRYGGDADRALAAYNWGPGNVDSWVRRGADPATLPAETQAYVRRVRGRAVAMDAAAPA